MSVIARLALTALCAAAPFPRPQPGLTLAPASGLDFHAPPQEVVPRFSGEVEDIVVTAQRAPMQADPHAETPRFKDTPESLQAYDLWGSVMGSPPCCQSPYETDIGGQPGRP